LALVRRNCDNIDLTCQGIRERNMDMLYAAFMNQPLCGTLTMDQGRELLRTMCENTREYLDPYYPSLSI